MSCMEVTRFATPVSNCTIFNTTRGLRVQVGSKPSDDMPLSVRVYPGNFPYPGNLPDAALR
jgi:hypothetical protein